ncbi:hypothetical protein HYH02_004831 [Chlamydomonas schloesseri]|uniref:Uncharacterized protein n=1 Tax=Chlamydomonas schloesseri TaxID=2026947 RepID=A0A835WMS7_9CHLO|nr:hypothetical protein HYH02_004831 [Chlamydomonas schloesseri]|eukprot:KAG2450326.1 hypothetical protein HYH02_004831 [Chlamydomonas schloesseri]
MMTPKLALGYYALTGFCRYPGLDILGFDLGCYSPAEGACPLGTSATSSTLHAAAEACAANPGCRAFTSDGWLKSTGLQSFATKVEYMSDPGQGLFVKRPSTGSPLDAFCFYQSQDIFGNTLFRSSTLPDVSADGRNAENLASLCLGTPGCLAFNTQQYLKRTADLARLKPLPTVFPNPGQGIYVLATLPAREFALSSFCPYPGQDIVDFNIRCGLPLEQGGCARNRIVDRSQLLALAAACSATPGCLAFNSEGWLKSAGAEALHPPPVSYMTLPLQGAYVLRPRVVRYATDWFCFYPGRDMPGEALPLLDEEEPDVGYPSFRNAQALAQVCLESDECLAFTTRTKFTSNGDVGQLVANATLFPGVSRTDPSKMGDALPFVDLGTGITVTQLSMGRIAAGTSCALVQPGGRIKCWGYNRYFAIPVSEGDGNVGAQPGEMGDALPFVNLGTNATAVSVVTNGVSACAVLEPGNKIKCWGTVQNTYQAGYQTINAADPKQMGDNLPFVNLGSNITQITQLVMGASFYCALVQPGGRVKCWTPVWLPDGKLADRGGSAGQMGDNTPVMDMYL